MNSIPKHTVMSLLKKALPLQILQPVGRIELKAHRGSILEKTSEIDASHRDFPEAAALLLVVPYPLG